MAINPMFINISPEICAGVFILMAALFAAFTPLYFLHEYLKDTKIKVLDELSKTQDVVNNELRAIKNDRFLHGL